MVSRLCAVWQRISAGASWRTFAVTVYIVAAVALAPIFLRRPLDSDWYRCFVRAADRMQAGETIHVVERNPYAYPPIMALLTIPLAKLPTSLGFLAWYVVNLVAFGVLLRSSWRLIEGPNWSAMTGRWFAVGAVGLLLTSRYFVGTVETRQFDLVIVALLFSGLERLCDQRRSGAVLLGLAAGMKCTPLLFVPYLLWRGRTASAAVVCAVAAVVNVVPDLLYHQHSGRLYLQDWHDEFLVVAGRVPPGTWFSGLIQNQSLAGMSQRLFRYGLPTSLEAVHKGKLAAADVPSLRAVVAVVSGTLLFATGWFLGRPRISWKLRDLTPSFADRLRFPIEASAILALMILLSPMTSRAHLSSLLLPSLLLCKSAFIDRNRMARFSVGALAILGPVAAKGIVGKTLGELALAWSFPTWFAFTVLVGMWLLSYRRTPRNVDEPILFSTRFDDGIAIDRNPQGAAYPERRYALGTEHSSNLSTSDA